MNNYRGLLGFFSFALAVAGIILLLKVMNWLPHTVQQNTLRAYDSIDQARSALGLHPVFIPSYFPQEISWPPATILAQTRPFPALILTFTDARKSKVVLDFAQAAGELGHRDPQIDIIDIKEEVRFMMHEKNATLTVGECRDREPCSMISWQEDGLLLSLRMRAAPFELLRIAESIRR